MSDPWGDLKVSPDAQSITIDWPTFCTSQSEELATSPIDRFIEFRREVVKRGTPDNLVNDSDLGRLLLLGLTSGVEAFVRELVVGSIGICPISKRSAGKHNIAFGSIAHYGTRSIAGALLENVALSDSDAIAKALRNLLGLEINRTPARITIDEFDRLCHLRHAAVHRRGELGFNNADAIGLPVTSDRQLVNLGFAELQSAAAICQNAVLALNTFVFNGILQRFIKENFMVGEWAIDKSYIKPLFDLFASEERDHYPNAYHFYRNLKTRVKP